MGDGEDALLLITSDSPAAFLFDVIGAIMKKGFKILIKKGRYVYSKLSSSLR